MQCTYWLTLDWLLRLRAFTPGLFDTFCRNIRALKRINAEPESMNACIHPSSFQEIISTMDIYCYRQSFIFIFPCSGLFHAADLNTSEFPDSYKQNTQKENTVLENAENYRRQYVHLFRDRQPLLLNPLNECGIEVWSVLLFCCSSSPGKGCTFSPFLV